MALYATGAERAYLGSLLIQAAGGWDPEIRVSPEMFTQLDLAEALTAYKTLRAQKRPANEIAVAAVTGNAAILRECMTDVTNSQALDEYAAQIAEAARRRRLVELAQHAVTVAQDEAADLNAELPIVADNIAGLRQSDRIDNVHASIEAETQRLYDWSVDKSNKLLGITTGIKELDRWSYGFRKDFYGIGGRPGMGKSSLALQCIDGQTAAGLHVFWASLEMRPGACAARIAFQRMGIAKEDLTALNRDQFAEHCADVADNPNLTWYTGANSTRIDDLIGAILDAHRERPIDMVWIDHLTKIKHRPGKENLAHRVGQTTKALAELQLRLECPVALLAQLNRDGADGEPPQMSAFRDSGEIEEDLRWGWMLHWNGYYETPRPAVHVPQPFDIYQRKTQDEACDVIPLMWMQKCAKFLPRQFGAK